MIRRLLYLFALAFVLQMSAGVVSAYCMHETGQASQHFGHHQHEHKAAPDDGDGGAPSKKAASHPDCASCTHGASVVSGWTAPSALPFAPTHQQHAQATGLATPFLGLPERPNWMIVA